MWSLFVRLLLSSSNAIVHFPTSSPGRFPLALEVGEKRPGDEVVHFLVAASFCFKVRLSAKPVKWKLFFILMQIKLIITRKVLHLASYWKWGLLEIEMASFMLYTSKCWLSSRFIETVLGKMVTLFFQRLIGHWVLLHLNLTHITFCALFAHASFSKICILKTFVCKRSCANVQR